MGKPAVLLVSPGDDVHALSVQHRLAELTGDDCFAHIVDTRTFPQAGSAEWRSGQDGFVAQLRIAEPLAEAASPQFVRDRPIKAVVDLSDIVSVWLRRPGNVCVDPQIAVPEFRHYAQLATHATLASVFATCTTHNRPSAEHRLKWKPLQLYYAERAGFRIPQTLVTASSQEALAFVHELAARHSQVIYKQVVSTGDGPPTRLFSERDRERIGDVPLCPTTFQERIAGGPDLRIAVIGATIFAAEWRTADGPPPGVDVRFEPGVALWPVTFPQDFQSKLFRLQNLLELSIGIYDFKLDAQGTPHFLEVNPAGQWLPLELEAGWPISWSLAKLLAPGFGSENNTPEPFQAQDLEALMNQFETSLLTQAG